jgi:hypothetical protein
VCVVNALFKGVIEDQKWFEDRWMVASLCDEDNVVWTNYWLSIAGAGCALTGVGAGEEQARKVSAGEASRLSSRDPVASGVKCGPHGGKNGKMKSWKVSWLSLKTKVEPGLRGIRVMSTNWRRLHRVCRVSCGSPENR